MRIIPVVTLILLATASLALQARAETRTSGLDPGLQCRNAIRAAERDAGIPEHLMTAIGLVESGRRGPDGSVNPWPWSINAEGTDYVFETKQAVIAAVRALQNKGVHSIDVGCMQVNLMYHPQAFATLDEAFDPVVNARYAARFLVELKAQTGAWDRATACYHSATPELGGPYQRKVMAVLPEEKKRAETEMLHNDLAAAWGATLRPIQPDAGFAALSTPHRSASAPGLAMAWAAGRGAADSSARTASSAAGRAPHRTQL